MNINDLPPLIDIVNTFDEIIQDIHAYCNEDEQMDLIEQVTHALDEYVMEHIHSYASPKFDTLFDVALENIVVEIIDATGVFNDEDIHYDTLIDTICYKAKQIYFCVRPKRSHRTNALLKTQPDEDKKHLHEKIKKLERINNSLPEQRTEEWYQMRYNLLSASSIWKTLDSQCNINAIIYEKCKPLQTEKYNNTNTNTPFHWGQKYEPVSQMYYEHAYDATITEYGCIPHTKYSFLGASPDGINTKLTSSRFGRMLEIKNIVNREITGIPKKEYWIQTQLQMECCDLNECDFLECKFNEYETEDEFNADGDFQYTSNGNYKGIILQFSKDNKPLYEYMPFNATIQEYEEWYEAIMEKHSELTWLANIYWRLDEISCVLIERNTEWFQSVVNTFESVWKQIEIERETGYEHRKPNKRTKTTKKPVDIHVTKLNNGVCNIKLVTDEEYDTNAEVPTEKNEENAQMTTSNTTSNTTSKLKSQCIIQIDTTNV